MYSKISSDVECASSIGRVSENAPLKGYHSLEVSKGQDLDETSSSNQKRAPVLYVVVGLLVAVVMILSSIIAFGSGGSVSSLYSSSGETRSCTFAECQRTMCDENNSPFVCTAGKFSTSIDVDIFLLIANCVCFALFPLFTGAAHDGCASTAAAWAHNSVCTDYCDISQCSSTEHTSTDDTIGKCDACTPSECLTYGTKCTSPDVFVCVDGSARYGCSADQYQWPSSINSICNACCDTTTCSF